MAGVMYKKIAGVWLMVGCRHAKMFQFGWTDA